MPGRARARAGQALARQIVQPGLQVGQAAADALLALLFALAGLGRGSLGLLRRLRGCFLGFLFLALLAAVEPVRHPLGRGRRRKQLRLGAQQKIESEAMLARELAARAGALEGRLADVDLGTVGDFSAALALSPQGALVASEQAPFGWRGQLAAGFGGGSVGSQRENVI